MSEAGSDGRKLLIVGAHSGDFVWRAAGAVAAAPSPGGAVGVVALSYGERGGVGELWEERDQESENTKGNRSQEGEGEAQVRGGSL